MRTILAAMASATLLTACIPDVLNTKPEVRGLEGAAPMQTLTDPKSGTDVTLRPGGKLRLRLDSNPTTGYNWVVKGLDEAVLAVESKSYEADPVPEGVVGSGGTQIFVFEALARGKTTLELHYQRSDTDVFEELNVQIKVIAP